MEVDESIVLLGAELDAWWDEFSPLLDTDDSAAQATALLRGFEIAKRFNRLKTEGLTAIQALLDRHGATEDVEPASLVRAFAFAAKLANTLHDEFRDIDGETQVARFTEAIVKTLEESESGRTPLAVLLDHPDAGVRAWAGACLMYLLPDRVIPILREIMEKEDANCAHFTAYFALLRWEHDPKPSTQRRVGSGESAVPIPHLWLKILNVGFAALSPWRLPLLDLFLRCRCGHVCGVAREVSPSAGFRFVCYCKDCQAFARFLNRLDVLDAAGGTGIFQMAAGRVKLTAGTDVVRCLTFSSKVLRWYADCCRTPIANTAASRRFPVVALIHSFMSGKVGGRSRDEVLGPPLCRIHERSAIGQLPAGAPPRPSFGVFAHRAVKVLVWWARGLSRPNPFFDDRTNAPLSVPQMLTSEAPPFNA